MTLERKGRWTPASSAQLRRLGLMLQAISWLSTAATARIALWFFSRPRRRSSRKNFSPTPNKILRIPFQDFSLKAYCWGEGPTIYLFHGWEARALDFALFVKPLLLRGFRVVALDGPAHGASGGRRTNLSQFGQALRLLMEQVGPAYAIVAHSFGAAATVFLLERKPHLAPQKLVLIGTFNELSTIIDRFCRSLRLRPAVREEVFARLERRLGKPVRNFSLARVAADFKMPGLIIHDQDDLVIPVTEAQAIARAWPSARLRSSAGLGHFMTLRNPKLIAEIAVFLAGGERLAPAAIFGKTSLGDGP